MEYIVKASTHSEEYTNAWDNSSSSSEVTALVTHATPTGMAQLLNNVDELNIVLNMLNRPNLPDIIKMFGSSISLEEMYLVALFGEPTVADIEEYIFSKKYAQWVDAKRSQAHAQVSQEHRSAIKERLEAATDAYEALCSIASDKCVNPVSRKFYTSRREYCAKKILSHPVVYGLDEKDVETFIDVFTLENLFMLYDSYASDESLEKETFWNEEARRNPMKYDEAYDDMEYYVHERNITIAPFRIPESGVLVLAESNSGSYYCD